ncbi:MAG: ABC transporter ATP-binding protein [Rhodospirillales bacterium]|nr:ABC transporter ATP-binding protein [Rhodospirillales bacterium]
MSALLAVEGISKSFRGLKAASAVSFELDAGAILGLIGPNGAGKTTVFNMIAGVFPPDEGRVRMDGQDISGKRPDQICRAGIGRTFQIVKPFGGLTVRENVIVGALASCKTVADAEREADRVLDLLGLADKSRQPAHALTLPDRKCLEVARALATRPKLLLLDEVMAGLRPTETDRMVAIFRQLNRETGLTILLIEHVMRAVMALAQRIVVLNTGEVIATGTPEEIAADQKVRDCYLGEEAA